MKWTKPKFRFNYYKKPWLFELAINKCGYFDGRPEISIYLWWASMVIHLPWINEKWTDECDSPKYGIAIHNNTFWVYLGGKGNMRGGNKWWTWEIPFFSMNHYKHYIKGKDGNWIDCTNVDWKWQDQNVPYLYFNKRNPQESIDEDNRSLAKIYYDIWVDGYDLQLIEAKYRVEKRIWRPKWLGWTSKFQYVKQYIDVCFKEEVGSQKGSWKGGTLGASQDMLPGETPQKCFKRMNKEREL